MNETREYIIDQSYKLFLNKSYEAVSISDISKAIGLTKGALYHHFKNKEDLFKAVIDKYLLLSELSNIPDKITLSQFIDEAIKKATEIIYNIFGETPVFVSINYFAIFIDAFRHYPGFADDKNHLFSTEIDKIKYILDNAVKSGEIRRDIDTSVMALNFFSIALGIVATLFRNNSPTSAIDILKSQMDEFYKILKTP